MARKPFSARAKGALFATLALPAVGVAIIGFAHTKAGRPLLGWLASAGGCPTPIRKSTPAEREGFRLEALRKVRGQAPAASRPALGFSLEATTFEQAGAWARSSGARCEVDPAGASLHCYDVPAAAVGGLAAERPIDDLLLTFRPDGQLVSVDAMRRGLDAYTAGDVMTVLASRLEHEAGPSAEAPPASPALHDGQLGQAAVRFRFSNYAADVSATSLPWSGVMLRERYSSI